MPHAVEFVPWGHGLGRWLADLTDVANRDSQAQLLAESVRRYKTERPLDPIYLVAKSGGSGVVVKALELLDEQQVERAVMLAPALSPAYDLSNALRAVRREMVVFWSPLDVIILGVGTRVFGTVDRIKTASAGLVGFRVPAPREARTTTKASNTTNCARFAGGRGWRPPVIWEGISGRIVPYFCGDTWCRCFGLKRLPDDESRHRVKLYPRGVDIHMAWPALVLAACRCPGCRSGSI